MTWLTNSVLHSAGKKVNTMNDESPSLRHHAIWIAGVAFLAGWVLSSSYSAARPGSAFADDDTVVRNVVLDYMYETDPGSASGNKALAVDSIEFHPGYVLVTDSRGRTQLFAVDRLRSFSYRPAEPE